MGYYVEMEYELRDHEIMEAAMTLSDKKQRQLALKLTDVKEAPNIFGDSLYESIVAEQLLKLTSKITIAQAEEILKQYGGA